MGRRIFLEGTATATGEIPGRRRKGDRRIFRVVARDCRRAGAHVRGPGKEKGTDAFSWGEKGAKIGRRIFLGAAKGTGAFSGSSPATAGERERTFAGRERLCITVVI